jgi:hypothetical protein
MELMTKETEKKIVSAIEKVAAATNEGGDPSEEIAKIATDMGLNRDMTTRLVEGYNVSRTLAQQKQAQGEAKAASFPVADPDQVFSIMYPSDIASPAEEKAAAWIPSDTYHRETRFFKHSRAQNFVVGAAPAPKLERGGRLLKKAYDEVEHRKRDVENARRKAAGLYDKLRGSISKIAHYFRQHGHAPFEQVEKAAQAEYGDGVTGLFDLVWEHSKAAKFGEKRASAETMNATARYSNEPYVSIKEAMDLRVDLKEARDAHEKLAAEAAELKSNVDARARAMSKGAAGFGTGILADRIVHSLAKAKPPSVELAKAIESLQDPDYEAERQGIQAKAMLYDLLNNDEVLSQADPQTVIDAYNELTSTAPQAMQQPAAVRSYLRKAVEQGAAMDPIDVAGLTSLEKTVKDVNEPDLGAALPVATQAMKSVSELGSVDIPDAPKSPVDIATGK